MLSQTRTKLLLTLLASLALCALVFASGAGAQRGGSSRRANQNARAEQTKRVFVGRGSETRQGSRVTITADDTLKDYSAYRSGDRFYVVLPKSAAGSGARGGVGRGYTDMQVEQRGDSVVLSYRVQPGAKPRVEQKFNRLDVVFDVPDGGGQQAAASNDANAARAQQPAQPVSRNPAPHAQQPNQTTAAPSQPNTNSMTERRAAPLTPAEAARTQAPGAAPVNTAPPVAVADPNAPAAATPPAAPVQEAATPAVPANEPQVAQAQPPAAVAPITATNPATDNQAGASLGTFLLRNWALALVVVLFVAGLGLILAARRTTAGPPAVEALGDAGAGELDEPRAAGVREESAAALREASIAAKASQPEAEVASSVDEKPVVVASALAGGEAVAKSRKQTRKEARQEAKRKKKGARGDSPAAAEASPVVQEPFVQESPAEETLEHSPVVEETAVAEEEAASTLPAVEVAAAVEPPAEEVTEVVPLPAADSSEITPAEPAIETAAGASVSTEAPAAAAETVQTAAAEIEPAAPVTEIEPAFAADPERVQAETRRLLEGEAYDRAVIGTSDPMARQMIAAELLSALAGRNAQRRERAGAAFVEQGFFDEAARDLREADAPAERAAAARSLALLGDRAATPHLVGALEDPATDVRRAAVETLGALRDPSAVAPLEALLEREKNERNRIPHRVIRNAADACREGAAELRAETPAVVPAPETRELVPATEPASEAEPVRGIEPVPAVEVASAIEPTPVVGTEHTDAATSVEIEPVAEAAPELEAPPPVEAASPETTEETSVSIASFVEERGVEPVQEVAPAREMPSWFARGSGAPFAEDAPAAESHPFVTDVSEELSAAESQSFETAVAEPEAVVETGLQPYVEAEEPEVVAAEESSASPAEEVALEPFVGPAPEPVSGQAELFDERHAEPVREIEPAPPASAEEAAPSAIEAAAGEWFDFDISELHADRQTASAEPGAVRPAAHAPVFESSSSDTLAASAEAETLEFEPAPSAGARAESAREIEPVAGEPAREDAREEAPPAVPAVAAGGEKGLALFDEFSTVPASIQQRLASREPAERAAAIVELSHVDTDEAFHQICEGFDDPAKEVRSAAARALYELRADRAESFTRALREASPERRREIGAAIASSGLASESISQLTGESREKTYEAFSLLFLMAKAGEVQPLVRAIEGHPSNEVRLAVVKLLALSGQKEILPAFRRLAVRGSLPTEVRSAVMEAIYQISSSQPTPA